MHFNRKKLESTALDIFYDGNIIRSNHTINYAEENSASYASLHRSSELLGGGIQHVDGPLQVTIIGGPYPCDPCGVDAHVGNCESICYRVRYAYRQESYFYYRPPSSSSEILIHAVASDHRRSVLER